MAKNRKDKIEMVLTQSEKIDGAEAIQAWRRLCRELEFMTHPEAKCHGSIRCSTRYG